jgi:hypothetical protein
MGEIILSLPRTSEWRGDELDRKIYLKSDKDFLITAQIW